MLIKWSERGGETSRPAEQPPSATARFRVQLGHAAVTVQGRSASEAIRSARRQLSLDMPRLWDVIHTADDSRFVACQLQ